MRGPGESSTALAGIRLCGRVISEAARRRAAPIASDHTGRWMMKAIVVTDEAAGTAGMKLTERPEPPAAINGVIVQVYASGFVPTEMEGPSTWTDRRNRDRTPSILSHELAGVATALDVTAGTVIGKCIRRHRAHEFRRFLDEVERNAPADLDIPASWPITEPTRPS